MGLSQILWNRLWKGNSGREMQELKRMNHWLTALRKETLPAWWAIVSAISTGATFFPHILPSSLRPLAVISVIAAVLWANFRVYQKQEAEKQTLRASLATHEARLSDLVIVPDPGSRYILSPLQNVSRGDFSGGYFEFHLMIDNRGRRNSTVTRYQVDIPSLNRVYPSLNSVEGQNGIQGRHCMFGMNPTHVLSTTRNVEIAAESTTRRGILLFHIPDLSLEDFASAGMNMSGQDRKFGELECRLTITDLTGVSASHTFTFMEA